MADRPPQLIDWVVLIILAIIWGGSFIFIKRSVGIFEPTHAALWRLVESTVLYIPIAVAYWSRIPWHKWRLLVLVALLGSGIPAFLFAFAQSHVSSSLAGVLNALTPVFTLLLGYYFFQRSYTVSRIFGMALGLGGAILLITFNSSAGLEGNAFYAGLCVLATLCYATNAHLIGYFFRDYHPAAVASAAFVVTGSFFCPALYFTGAWHAALTHPQGLNGVGYVFYLAALGTVGGSIGYFWLIQRTSPVFATSVTYLIPVMAIMIGVMDGEAVNAMDWVGMGVILTGIYLVRS